MRASSSLVISRPIASRGRPARKVDEHIREGGISRTRAAQLHSELNQAANATATN
jgi:hypothetical protein